MDSASTQEMVKAFLGGLARHGLTTVGGMLTSAGVLNAHDENAFVGAGMVFAGIAWSWWQKYGSAKAMAVAKAVTKKL